MKKNSLNKKILGLLFMSILLMVGVVNTPAFADDSVGVSAKKGVSITSGTYNLLAPIGKISQFKTDNIGDYLNMIFKLGIGLCAALAVVIIIIGGIQYMGDESVFVKTEAKDKMLSAIMGLFIALGAYAILYTLNPVLTGEGGVKIDQISVEITDINNPKYQYVTSRTGLTKAAVSTWTNQEWHNVALATVNASSLPSITPTDTAMWFPGVAKPTPENWVGLLAGMAKAESNFNKNETYTENFKDKNGVFVVSTGLFQISQESARAYGFPGITTEELKDPAKNIQVAVKILEWWVKRDGVIASTVNSSPKYLGGARYWSVLRIK